MKGSCLTKEGTVAWKRPKLLFHFCFTSKNVQISDLDTVIHQISQLYPISHSCSHCRPEKFFLGSYDPHGIMTTTLFRRLQWEGETQLPSTSCISRAPLTEQCYFSLFQSIWLLLQMGPITPTASLPGFGNRFCGGELQCPKME